MASLNLTEGLSIFIFLIVYLQTTTRVGDINIFVVIYSLSKHLFNVYDVPNTGLKTLENIKYNILSPLGTYNLLGEIDKTCKKLHDKRQIAI